jgi:arsenate reductase-like glutaredoxin family protein
VGSIVLRIIEIMETYTDFSLPDFWKKASNTIETLILNPCKFNNSDLLEPLPEFESPYRILPILPPFHLKSSSLDTSYKNYNPKHMEVIQRSKRFESISDQRKMVRTPKVLSKTSDFSSFKEIKESFQIAGRKAKIMLSLPDSTFQVPCSLDLNTRLKEFIGKVQDKYANLVKALDFHDETLSFDSVIGYLTKSSILLKRPTYTRDRQRLYSKSPAIYTSKLQTSNLQESFSSRISEKLVMLTVFSK